MELPIRAPADATVTAVHCREGELVQPDAIWSSSATEPLPCDAASPSSKSARATACRTKRRRVDGRQDRVRQPAERGRPAGHRGVGVRQPEMGAADGGRRGGVRRHRAAAGDPLYGAGAEPRRARARARRRRPEIAVFAAVVRDVQPQEHQPEHRRVVRRATGRSATARAARGSPRARLSLDRVRLSVRRARAARAGRATSRRG